MKKHHLVAMLIIMIGISAAVSDMGPGKEDYRLPEMNLNPAIVSSDDEFKVIIEDGSFQPSAITIPAGSKVEWHNQGEIQHTVVSDDPQSLPLSSGLIMPGKRYSFTFNTPGVYSYHCSIQEEMRGKIIVKADDEADEKSDDESTGGLKKVFPAPSWSELPMSRGQSAAIEPLSTVSQSAGQGLQVQITNPAAGAIPVSSAAPTISSEASSRFDLQKFSPYYSMEASESGALLASPAEAELNDIAPQMIYYGSDQKAVPYSQYQTYAASTGSNSLWISGASSWTQYVVVPFGSYLNMIAATPSGGYGYLYKIHPDGTLDKSAYSFYPYNLIGFYADKLGENQLFFNIDGQPSNVIVIYVVPDEQIQPTSNLASITIRSTWQCGYNLYVDGSYAATEGTTGEEDGVLTINVPGDQSHNIAIDGSGITFSDYKYFQAGYAYQLNI